MVPFSHDFWAPILFPPPRRKMSWSRSVGASLIIPFRSVSKLWSRNLTISAENEFQARESHKWRLSDNLAPLLDLESRVVQYHKLFVTGQMQAILNVRFRKGLCGQRQAWRLPFGLNFASLGALECENVRLRPG